MTDRTQIIYEILTAASPLATQIGTRAYSPISPDSSSPADKHIIFHQASSGSHITGSTNTASFIFKVYGGSNTYSSARELFGLLYDRLQMISETVAAGTIITARLETDSQLPPEPGAAEIKAHLASFSIQFEG